MTFEEFIKKGRIDAHLTRDQAAEAIGVEPRTIAKWEDVMNPSKPTYEKWSAIINAYNLDRIRFRDIYFEDVCPSSEDMDPDVVPEILFDEFDYEIVKGLTFTSFETELLKNLAIWCPDWMEDHSGKYIDVYKALPEYLIRKIDIADFRRIMDHLFRNKFHNSDELFKMVAGWITKDPYVAMNFDSSPVKKFDIRDIPLDYILDIACNIDSRRGLSYQVILMMKEIKKGNTLVFRAAEPLILRVYRDIPQYVNLREDYFSDEWFELIQIVDEKREFNEKYYGATICDANFYFAQATLIRNENEEFLNSQCRIGGDYMKFEYKFDNINAQKVGHYYVPEMDFITECRASLTERGEELWEFLKNTPELSYMTEC